MEQIAKVKIYFTGGVIFNFGSYSVRYGKMLR